MTTTASLFNPKQFIEEQIAKIKTDVKGHAVIATSGGVDSTVAAAIVGRALGKDLTAVYVDTGFMRKGETDQVKDILSHLGIDVRIIKAGDEFLAALKGVTDPEKKRKIIGEKFIRIFERVAKEVKAQYLVQGTIAPDWIESGGGARDVIKSHHNVGGLPKDMQLKLVEPLYDLYKDEVRKVARELGLAIAERQPFPGPGLAIRVMGELTKENVELVRQACDIVETEIELAFKAGKLNALPWQYFAVLLPVRSVGVQGDIRAYGHTMCVRAVASIDAMSATYFHLPHDVLEKISRRITNTLKDHVNRVVFDITDKPPGTVEWE
ncbi:MAG TPA: glutamine-hydrolyzing GMP synthase [Candidatus Thermoplasmatota archaeon]|nr:glutamine-hydrolyzing GMP synthase [Candidatus Thermoplasmatota archaeon]